MNLKKWIGSGGAIAAMAILTAQPAHAALVTFSTSGVFGCGSAAGSCTDGSTLVVNGTSLDFTGVTLVTREVPPDSFTSFGAFGTSSGDQSALNGATFKLTVTQVDPASSGNFSSTLYGKINASLGSTAYVLFGAPLSITLTPFSYSIESKDSGTDGRVNLNPVPGSVTVNGKVSYVPEPASAMLLGVALLGLVGVSRRFQLQ